MENTVLMNIVQSEEDVSDEELGFCLREGLATADVVAEVASLEEVHDEEDLLSVLKGGKHVDNETVFKKVLAL
jgi:hypothetical protein